MSDDFGLLNLVVSPFLERIGREERMNGDHPGKSRNQKVKTAKKQGSDSSEETQKTDDSMSSEHIDLRI